MSAEYSQTTIEIERWFRYHGLPYLVNARRWGSELDVRVVPLLVFITLVDIAASILDLLPDTFSDDEILLALGFLALYFVLALVVPILIAVFAARILRRRPPWRHYAAPVLIFVMVILEPFVIRPLAGGADGFEDAWTAVIFAASAYLLTWLGVGSFLGWAGRTAISQYAAAGSMAVRALPLLTVVVLLSMFSSPLWTTTDKITPERMLGVGGFFLIIGIAFVNSFGRGGIRLLSGASDTDHVAALLEGTPAEGVLREPVPSQEVTLPVLVRFNLSLTVTVTLVFQVFVLATLVYITLLIFGTILIGPEVVAQLTGHPAVYLQILGIDTPFIAATSNMALFLAAFSGLQFIIQVGTNREQKDTYYLPLVRNARTALAVESVYRELILRRR